MRCPQCVIENTVDRNWRGWTSRIESPSTWTFTVQCINGHLFNVRNGIPTIVKLAGKPLKVEIPNVKQFSFRKNP
jgi:hypothetical protein